jgi:hypothetical protein
MGSGEGLRALIGACSGPPPSLSCAYLFLLTPQRSRAPRGPHGLCGVVTTARAPLVAGAAAGVGATGLPALVAGVAGGTEVGGLLPLVAEAAAGAGATWTLPLFAGAAGLLAVAGPAGTVDDPVAAGVDPAVIGVTVTPVTPPLMAAFWTLPIVLRAARVARALAADATRVSGDTTCGFRPVRPKSARAST